MLYYIHGYQSNPNSIKGTLFQKKLQAKAIQYRDGKPEDLIISKGLKRINTAIQDDPQAILIGSSLGGFLAAETALSAKNITHLILLNPAILPLHIDLSTIKDIPQRILSEMLDHRLHTQKINIPITILRGTQDTVIPEEWILSFARSQEATVKFYHDDHTFSQNLLRLPQIITSIIARH
jgi:predicted esterase YcpF (UPF0227 family)